MSYLENKKARLKTKYSNILQKDFGIEISDSPTNKLAICNGGLCSGITNDMAWQVFEKYGLIETLITVPGKSCSFLKYYNTKSAIKAFNNLNGKLIWPEIKGPIYLAYIIDFEERVLDQFKNFKKPPGLILLENFITEEEENFILSLIEFDKEKEKSSSSALKHRKVRHYGYEFKYSTNNVNLNEPIDKIPSELDFLWDKLKKCCLENNFEVNFIPDQLTVNCYEPGQGIPPHVDTHSPFEDGILSLSLQSSVVMEFKNKIGDCYKVLLPRRSLCIMQGESRYDWTHCIPPRKSDIVLDHEGFLQFKKRETRTSLTFRKTRVGKCMCKFPTFCDSFRERIKSEKIVADFKNINIGEEVASGLEENYVHEVYEKIASHFSETRHKPWPNVMKFVESFETGSIIVDVGCGNGKYFSKQSKCFEVGCDRSSSLMQVCKEKGFECFSCNCLNIPIRDGLVDGCICIAVLHHLTTEERRQRALKEIIRILRNKGKALIYVWAKNQEKGNSKSTYLKHCSKSGKHLHCHETQLVKLQDEIVLPVHVNRTNFGYNDLLVPWKLKGKHSKSAENPVYLRFYHVYEDEELNNVCLGLEGVNILDYYYDQGNWCIMLEKI